MNGGFVADGKFLVSGGHGAVALEPVDAALHSMALFVDLGIEGRWLPALEPLARAGGHVRIRVGGQVAPGERTGYLQCGRMAATRVLAAMTTTPSERPF